MFTGIVEELGRVLAVEPAADGGVRLTIEAATVLGDVTMGASIAVNGCCLTVVGFTETTWQADAVAETLARTNLGELRTGDPVNLERPVRLSDRLGGHLVQGHVDATGTVVTPAPELRIAYDDALARYLVEKGSITVDGISLTVVEPGPGTFTVAVIPHTMAVTTLGHRAEGDLVNLEVDVMAKHAERLLEPYLPKGPR